MLVNDVGMTTVTEDDGLCAIDIAGWFIAYTIAIGLKLFLTSSRYYQFKKNRLENIPLYLTDLAGMNLLMTAIFIKANIMYFSDDNKCFNTSDTMLRRFYYVFCTLTLLGYFQFIWCILLSCSIPLSAFLIYQLVEHRLNMRREMEVGLGSGLIGGLM